MAETKPKSSTSLRTPGPKKKLGLSVPPALRLPHEDLIPAAPEPKEKEEPRVQTGMTSQTPEAPSDADGTSVAPQKDFTKVANSIGRQAVPAGLFTGKSKQLYDCLYSLTRGAIVPARSIRISRSKLMKKANIGSRVTFDANIERLIAVGLIEVRPITGEHKGNEYTVNLPEEALSTMPSLTSLTSLTGYAQKLVRLVRLETRQTRHSSSLEESTTYDLSKTSFKTKTNFDDDEALAGFVAVLKKVVREVTGQEPSAADAARWVELAEVLATELKIAAGRTTVSSAPAFLAEHLRRRLWKKEKRQIEAETAEQKTATSATPLDASKCPDCFGTGMYYPEGFEKGVARCPHAGLDADGEG